jgi:hypothetical protein
MFFCKNIYIQLEKQEGKKKKKKEEPSDVGDDGAQHTSRQEDLDVFKYISVYLCCKFPFFYNY